jgi:DNA-binding transcriptional LysR family regulator
VRVTELTRVPFLLYPRGTVLRVLIDRFFKDIGVSPKVVMEAEDTEAIKRLVESGFGYSILPEHALRRPTGFFQTFRVDGHPITRSLALAMVQTDYPRKLTVSIAESLRTMLTT